MRNHWMTEEEYKLVTQKTPIPTVDMVILRKNKIKIEALLLKRKTGYEKGKWCIIGGRIFIGETIQEAITRHISDLKIEIEIISPFSASFPAWINDNPLQDQTKHSITHVYPVVITNGYIRNEGEEYSGYEWFSIDSLPNMAYDHNEEITNVLERMQDLGSIVK